MIQVVTESTFPLSSETLVAASLFPSSVFKLPGMRRVGLDNLTVLSIDFLVKLIPLDARSELRYCNPLCGPYILVESKQIQFKTGYLLIRKIKILYIKLIKIQIKII